MREHIPRCQSPPPRSEPLLILNRELPLATLAAQVQGRLELEAQE